MKTRHVPNMRDIPTIQGLRNRSLPTNREQVMSEWARLEHEKARLERELHIWIANHKKTESRLQQVYERIGLLQQVLDQMEPKTRPEAQSTSSEGAVEGEKTGNWREIPLEY